MIDVVGHGVMDVYFYLWILFAKEDYVSFPPQLKRINVTIPPHAHHHLCALLAEELLFTCRAPLVLISALCFDVLGRNGAKTQQFFIFISSFETDAPYPQHTHICIHIDTHPQPNDQINFI